MHILVRVKKCADPTRLLRGHHQSLLAIPITIACTSPMVFRDANVDHGVLNGKLRLELRWRRTTHITVHSSLDRGRSDKSSLRGLPQVRLQLARP